MLKRNRKGMDGINLELDANLPAPGLVRHSVHGGGKASILHPRVAIETEPCLLLGAHAANGIRRIILRDDPDDPSRDDIRQTIA
jgi:hypothetical protein